MGQDPMLVMNVDKDASPPHPTSLRSATFPSRERLEERASQGLPLEGKLSATRLTDEVAGKRLRCKVLGMRKRNRAETLNNNCLKSM